MNGEQFFRKRNRIKAIVKCMISYIVTAIITASIFTGFIEVIRLEQAQQVGCLSIFKNSLGIFWGLDDAYGFEIYNIEIVVSHVIDMLYSALIVKAFLEDVGELVILDHFCIDTDKNELIIGYCYRSDPGEFLCDAMIKIQLLTYGDIKSGKSKMHPPFDQTYEYSMIRGVRYIEIPVDRNLRRYLKQLSNSDEEEKNLTISVMIKGQNSSGGWVSKIHHYYTRDCFNGYHFVPIQKREYDKGKKQDYVNMKYFGSVMACNKKRAWTYRYSAEQKEGKNG